MHIDFGTGLVVSALIGAIILAMKSGDRLVPGIALLTATVAALIDFRVIQLSSAKFRIDVILPAILTLTGGICWSRSSTKSTITAGTVVTLVGVIMLLSALRVLR
jgi:uncharacterized membrane protein YjjP (DUF1212 family)